MKSEVRTPSSLPPSPHDLNFGCICASLVSKKIKNKTFWILILSLPYSCLQLLNEIVTYPCKCITHTCVKKHHSIGCSFTIEFFHVTNHPFKPRHIPSKRA